MKTFLLSIPDVLRRKSETIDILAILCNKSWEIINEDGIKQVFIFKKDGRLIVSTAGDVTNSSWEYVPANRSLIIKGIEKATMFHLAYCDDAILALGKDGSLECLFMIDEMNKALLPQRSLQGLAQYFQEKELSLLKETESGDNKQTNDINSVILITYIMIMILVVVSLFIYFMQDIK